jgi:predicted DNA-binding WGR domain protein
MLTAVHLRRVDPPRNMRRFYRLDMQPDLFDGVLLMKEWGRIGTRARIMAEVTTARLLPTHGDNGLTKNQKLTTISSASSRL